MKSEGGKKMGGVLHRTGRPLNPVRPAGNRNILVAGGAGNGGFQAGNSLRPAAR